MANDRWRQREWEVLHQICLAHGIEISEPKKSRGYSYTVEEYGEHKDEIRRLEEEKARATAERDEVRSELDKAAKKKVKLTEIDSVETGKTVFGGKVTVSQEDWDNVTALAKKEVATHKSTKKLKADKKELLQKVADLEQEVQQLSAELASYKKKEEEKRYFSLDKLHSETKRISEKEQKERTLRKALAFIEAYGLTDEYQRFKVNGKARNATLE